MRIFISLAFILTFFTSRATDSTWNQLSSKFYHTTVRVNHIQPKVEKNVISSLQLIDLRHDKDRLGLYSNNLYSPYEILLEKGETLETLFNQKIVGNSTPGKKILIVIQDLWMTDIFPASQAGKNDGKPVIVTSKLICKADVFLKENETFVPLTRLDTTIWDKRKINIACTDLLEDLLSLLHQNINNEILANEYASRKKLNLEFLKNHYSKKLATTFNTNTVFKKGIYKTYDDFRNNTPTNVDFEITESDDEPAMLYIKDGKGTGQLTRDVWGVNDGKNSYIMQGGHVFRLYKNENAFYWMGLKIIRVKTVGVPAGVPLGGGWFLVGLEPMGTRVKFRTTPYLLNLEKGISY